MINNEEFDSLTLLCRIGASQEKKKILQKNIDSILDYVGKISEVSVDEKLKEDFSFFNITREDKANEINLFKEDFINEVPEEQNGYVKVHKIL